MLQKIKKIVIKTLKIFFLTIVGLHLALRITAFFEPGFIQLLYLTDEFSGTEFNDERFSHQKWMDIKVGTHKSEAEKIIKGSDLPNYNISGLFNLRISTKLKDSIIKTTLTSYTKQPKNNSLFYYSYNCYYDKNQILIAKFYYCMYD